MTGQTGNSNLEFKKEKQLRVNINLKDLHVLWNAKNSSVVVHFTGTLVSLFLRYNSLLLGLVTIIMV